MKIKKIPKRFFQILKGKQAKSTKDLLTTLNGVNATDNSVKKNIATALAKYNFITTTDYNIVLILTSLLSWASNYKTDRDVVTAATTFLNQNKRLGGIFDFLIDGNGSGIKRLPIFKTRLENFLNPIFAGTGTDVKDKFSKVATAFYKRLCKITPWNSGNSKDITNVLNKSLGKSYELPVTLRENLHLSDPPKSQSGTASPKKSVDPPATPRAKTSSCLYVFTPDDNTLPQSSADSCLPEPACGFVQGKNVYIIPGPSVPGIFCDARTTLKALSSDLSDPKLWRPYSDLSGVITLESGLLKDETIRKKFSFITIKNLGSKKATIRNLFKNKSSLYSAVTEFVVSKNCSSTSTAYYYLPKNANVDDLYPQRDASGRYLACAYYFDMKTATRTSFTSFVYVPDFTSKEVWGAHKTTVTDYQKNLLANFHTTDGSGNNFYHSFFPTHIFDDETAYKNYMETRFGDSSTTAPASTSYHLKFLKNVKFEGGPLLEMGSSVGYMDRSTKSVYVIPEPFISTPITPSNYHAKLKSLHQIVFSQLPPLETNWSDKPEHTGITGWVSNYSNRFIVKKPYKEKFVDVPSPKAIADKAIADKANADKAIADKTAADLGYGPAVLRIGPLYASRADFLKAYSGYYESATATTGFAVPDDLKTVTDGYRNMHASIADPANASPSAATPRASNEPFASSPPTAPTRIPVIPPQPSSPAPTRPSSPADTKVDSSSVATPRPAARRRPKPPPPTTPKRSNQPSPPPPPIPTRGT